MNQGIQLANEIGSHGILMLDSDILLITATINATGALVKSRATIATRIINSILMFNPLKHATSPLTTKSRIIIRSIERTIRALFVSILKRYGSYQDRM